MSGRPTQPCRKGNGRIWVARQCLVHGHATAVHTRYHIDGLVCLCAKRPGLEEDGRNRVITQALGYFGIPRVSPARARVRAGRSPLAPWGGSDVLGLGCRSRACQSSLSLNSDLAHLALLIPLMCAMGSQLEPSYERPLGAFVKLACCSKNAEPRGGQAQATPKVTNVPKSCHSLTRSSELLLANSQPQVVSRCLISVWIENCSSSPVARNSPRGPKSLRQIEAIPSYHMRAAGVISPEVAVTV